LIALLIIADDLTGAIDTGVQLAKQDIPTRVIHNYIHDIKKLFDESNVPVMVVNTESRHIGLREAASRVQHVITEAKKAGVNQFYKKTDSTMRGNIGAELEAFKIHTGQQIIGFIPAHPKLNRFTRNGFHYIGNALLHDTEFGKDPLEPITESYIPGIITEQTNQDVVSINLSETESLHGNNGILVFDCQSEADLKHIINYLIKINSGKAIAGSAAMVEFLPDLFHLKRETSIPPKPVSPLLLVNGSLNNISIKQVKFAHNKGLKVISIPENLLSDKNYLSNPLYLSLQSQIKSTFLDDHDIILSTSNINKSENSSNPNVKIDSYEIISEQIGLIVASILQEATTITLVVFGGDTLMGIMQALSCKYITPKLEILPGVALSLAKTKNGNIYIITKPGGYGEADVIMEIMKYMKKARL